MISLFRWGFHFFHRQNFVAGAFVLFMWANVKVTLIKNIIYLSFGLINLLLIQF